MKNPLNLILLTIIFLTFDRLTKVIFLNKKFSIINSNINQGALFGLFKNNPNPIIILSIIILLLLIITLIKTNYNKLSLILIFSGISGNLIDRIVYKGVIDFIDLKIWPIFNLADIFIISGIIVLLINTLKNENYKK
jgi:lipoprotein signal peptidase